MLQFSKWQSALVIGTIVLAALFALPNLLTEGQRNSLPGFLPKNSVNLGLDLQGGSYLLLQLDTDELIQNRLTSMRQNIQREMRPGQGRERVALQALPNINFDNRVISFRVRDADQVDEAADRARDIVRPSGGVALIGAAVRNYEVSVEGQRIEVRMTEEARRTFVNEARVDSIEVVRRRVDPAGNKEVSIQPQGGDRIVLQAPGDNDPEALKELITGKGQLTFHRVDASVTGEDAAAGLLPPGRILVNFAETEGPGALVLYEDPEVTGDMVQSASAGLNSDGAGFQINFAFDSTGARRFGSYTSEHVGELFAIVLDDEIISAPRIQSAITGGSGRITGNFTPDEAARIATLIRAGALPATLTTIEQRSVGPELGRDSIEAGTRAFVIGFIGVMIYMIVSYGRFGIYADIALIANIVLIAGLLSMFGSTLTLPGIAGIVLTIGMAVDANVLIFERVREEIAGGKTAVKALELGFEKARSAIIDANITTFGAALIMFMLGAGPVRGFAITLMIGVVTSVFSAYFLTRLLSGGFVLKARPKALAL
ncbi:MAG: protein translocase subunit SecD [Pseudomonadota bacterium]